MADPITLTLVGTVVLTEGIKFLYGQAGELLKRWRERSDAAQTGTVEAIESPLIASPEIFEGALSPLKADVNRIRELESGLRKLRNDLADYAQGIDTIDPSNSALISTTDALRQQLEGIYGQRITFKGERERPPSGTPLVVGEAEVRRLTGLAGGVIAGTVTEGEVRGKIKVEQVESAGVGGGVIVDSVTGGKIQGKMNAEQVDRGGTAAGVKVDKIGR
jgi:hypothetical protein